MRVATVLRTSATYRVEHVERLHRQVDRHFPDAEFVCLSDDANVPGTHIPLRTPWTSWWSKMELFAPWIEGDLLYIDLDTTIVGDISHFAQDPKVTLLQDFLFPAHVASGLMLLPAADRAPIWERFEPRAPHWIAHYSQNRPNAHWGDQAFLRDHGYGGAARWQDRFPRQVVSYRTANLDVMPIPEDARVICFHGKVKPWSPGVPACAGL